MLVLGRAAEVGQVAGDHHRVGRLPQREHRLHGALEVGRGVDAAIGQPAGLADVQVGQLDQEGVVVHVRVVRGCPASSSGGRAGCEGRPDRPVPKGVSRAVSASISRLVGACAGCSCTRSPRKVRRSTVARAPAGARGCAGPTSMSLGAHQQQRTRRARRPGQGRVLPPSRTRSSRDAPRASRCSRLTRPRNSATKGWAGAR